nr:MAG TPA: hypothetical protein [Bacteriophage sp.]
MLEQSSSFYPANSPLMMSTRKIGSTRQELSRARTAVRADE